LEVVELTVVSGTKGDAIRRLQAFHDPTATVFIGDDVTDEDGFDGLGDADLSVKVGPGESKARHRVAEPRDVSELLRIIGVAREEAFTRSGRLDLGPVN
jgi:trehalose-6-phosphatase